MSFFSKCSPFAFCLFVALAAFPSGADEQSEIESLKRQIEEIKRQNQEKILEIQRESQRQIEELRRKIEELEARDRVEQKSAKELLAEELKEKESGLKRIVDFNPDFPSYFRIRARFFKNATFIGATEDKDDEVFFVDSRFILSPMLKVTDNLSLRSQIDVARNIVWGGLGDSSVSQKFFESPSPSDSFRGALLREVTDTVSGNVLSPVEEDTDFFDIRTLYVVAKTPVGELWVGRQPYDWGLGMLVNAGSMPDQDLGSIVDRFEFDTAPLALIDERWEKLMFAFSIDRLSQGQSLVKGASGSGWEMGVGTLYRGDSLELGGYVFLLSQNDFDIGGGLSGDLEKNINWSLYGSYNIGSFFLAFEFQNIFGEINDLEEPLPLVIGSSDVDISAENFLFVLRGGSSFSPSFVDVVAAEFGWARGDDAATPAKLEGNAIFFNNAYTVDNLLFKHMIPNIYALEGSVINSWYFRLWSTLRLTESVYFTPQALFAWVDERNALSLDVVTPLPKVRRFLGAELEGTVTLKVLDHLWFDFISSFVVSGGGLKDLLSQRAFIEETVSSVDIADPPDFPFAFQGRLVLTLDPLIKRWTGSSTLLKRAFW